MFNKLFFPKFMAFMRKCAKI